MSRSRRLTAGALVVVAGAATTGVLLARHGSTDAAVEPVGQVVSTTEVIQQDVVTYEEATATLEFTTSVSVASPADGTVTSILSQGDAITAGTVVATVDGAPVVAMFGDVPGWRDLSADVSDGVDVRQLEQNLAALGFDPDGEMVVDEEFDDATTDAVERWETALGLDEDDIDGEVPSSQVVFVTGELSVDTIDVEVGGAASSGGGLLTARQTNRVFPITAAADTFVSNVATAGTPVVTGTVLYRSNYLPAVAIEGDQSSIPALSRDLAVGVDDGRDVRLLEQMLQDLGFTAGGSLVVDDSFDLATATSVLAWWQSVDQAIVVEPADLVVPTGSFVVVPAGLEVGAPIVADRTTIDVASTVLQLTAQARQVTTSAPVGDSTFALGAVIDVVFPDDSVSLGTVESVGTVATSSGTPGETPSIDIGIRVDDIPASVDAFVSIPVTLRVIDDQIDDAFVVPVSALVALAEGGYALEVDDGTTADGTPQSHLIAIETGLFTDGFVVVTGADLVAGLRVVVPS